MNPYLKTALTTISPYHTTYRTAGIILDANEATYPVPEALKHHMMTWMQEASINRYPDSDTTLLCQAIADAYHVPVGYIVCGVGSDQLIDCLLRSVLEQGDLVMAPTPSFSMYALTTQINGGTFIGIPLTEGFQYDFENLYKKVMAHQPRVTFICNPNNPTGCVLDLAYIEALLQVSEGIVVVDEAYIEFGGETACSLVKRYDNLLVLRTLSKAYGLAGARVGYGIGNPHIIEAILTIKPPYHLNQFSQEIATWVINHKEAYSSLIHKIKQERERLYDTLKALGYAVYPSQANFIWMRADGGLKEQLEQQGIFIKQFPIQEDMYYRISIGTETENNALLKVCEGERHARSND